MQKNEFELTILGISAATPVLGRHLSAQVLNVQGQYFLIDCGEGTLYRLLESKIKQSRIEQIFISHLHADHTLGLVGLMIYWSMTGRKSAVFIYSPEPEKLKAIVCQPLELLGHRWEFEIHFLPTNAEKSELIFENNKVTVYSIPLEHRIAAAGFLFREKKSYPRLNKPILEELAVPHDCYSHIKKGADWTNMEGLTIPNQKLVLPPLHLRSFAYCSDTIYLDSVAQLVQQVDLLYHEATFLHQELEKAERTRHSTALQAATIAQKAQVGQLIMGHFSVRYDDLSFFELEAKSIFAQSRVGEEGKTYAVPQTEELANHES